MPSTKTDTSIRYPESDNQKRRLRNVTQDRKAAERMQRQAGSQERRFEDATSWGTEQSMATTMDEDGNPQPDPASFSDGWKAQKSRARNTKDMDMYEAANSDFD